MNTSLADLPNLAGSRIADFHEAVEAFSGRLCEYGQSEWADRLRGAQNARMYAGDIVLRIRGVLRDLATRERSKSTDEAIVLLVECDAIWRG